MKLYATTTSERASKGQGGNKYLHIDILCKTDLGNEIISQINVETNDYNEAIIKYVNVVNGVEIGLAKELKRISLKGKRQKGKQQKGENYLFESPEKTIKRISSDWDSRYDDIV
jgi:hypothetical protein